MTNNDRHLIETQTMMAHEVWRKAIAREIYRFLRPKNFQAIALFRTITGAGLAESKSAIDNARLAWERENPHILQDEENVSRAVVHKERLIQCQQDIARWVDENAQELKDALVASRTGTGLELRDELKDLLSKWNGACEAAFIIPSTKA
jgi:hypothetical protein